jgi:hypothetical protein
MSPITIRESMIVKHFHRHKWELDNHWDNVDHIFGAPDPDSSIEDSDRQVAMEMVISSDEEEGEDDQDRLMRRRAMQGRSRRTEMQRKRHFGVINEDLPDDLASNERARPSQCLRK